VIEMLPRAESEFDGQSEQVAGPSMALYLPSAQSTQTPFVQDEPALHEQEIASAVTVVLAGHASQLADPVPVLYVPAPHFEHGPLSAPVYPALHSHVVGVILPGIKIESAGHDAQIPGPRPDLYMPVSHCEHGPPFCPVNPSLHWQEAADVPPIADVEFAGHCEQMPVCDPVNPALHRHEVIDVLSIADVESAGHCEQPLLAIDPENLLGLTHQNGPPGLPTPHRSTTERAVVVIGGSQYT